MREQVLIWSELTKAFHPLCFMRRTGDYLVGRTEHVEQCTCIPGCNCDHEEDFEAGLKAGMEDLFGNGVVN